MFVPRGPNVFVVPTVPGGVVITEVIPTPDGAAMFTPLKVH